MARKPRKPIADMIAELQSWLPNYDHGQRDYPTLVWRLLASMPGGDRAEDMGYESFNIAWQEIEQLGRMLSAIQDTQDVEDLIAGLEGGDFEVVVGNIGNVYTGTNQEDARDTFAEYKKQSKSGKGRAAGEDVTLFKDGEPIDEWHPTSHGDVDEARRGAVGERVSKADLEDFRGFCRNATDSQLEHIYEKERSAGRRGYANVAKQEMERRGLRETPRAHRRPARRH